MRWGLDRRAGFRLIVSITRRALFGRSMTSAGSGTGAQAADRRAARLLDAKTPVGSTSTRGSGGGHLSPPRARRPRARAPAPPNRYNYSVTPPTGRQTRKGDTLSYGRQNVLP